MEEHKSIARPRTQSQSSQPGGFLWDHGMMSSLFISFSCCDSFCLILDRYWQYGLGGLFDFCLEGRRPGRWKNLKKKKKRRRAMNPLQKFHLAPKSGTGELALVFNQQ